MLVLAAIMTLASFAGPIARVGLWDPAELHVAELSRRIACALLDAKHLELPGFTNLAPSLAELGRGQLPFTTIAIGFKLFGLSEWAGRLPLVLWGVCGVGATALLLARLADRVVAAWAALALATMPLYFLHARTMLGDIVTMAAVAMAVSGLSLATFDARAPRGWRSGLLRGAYALLGLLGMAAGFGARGLLIGVALPAVSVGLTWLILVAASAGRCDRLGHATGALSLTFGLAAGAVGGYWLQTAAEHPESLTLLLGAAVAPPEKPPTFDVYIRQLGHALFPWSALLPFAIGRVLRSPSGTETSSGFARQNAVRVTLMVTAAVGIGLHGMLVPTVGLLPYTPVFALAGIVALALRDLELADTGSRVLAMGVAALLILLWDDFHTQPAYGLEAFAVPGATFPESFTDTAAALLRAIALGVVLIAFYSLMESQQDADRRFEKDDYLGWPRTLRGIHGGNLLFGLLVLEATLLGLRALAELSRRNVLEVRQLDRLGALPRVAVDWGFVALPLLVVVAPVAALVVRDVFRTCYARLPRARVLGAGAAFVAGGLTLSLAYYPALASQVSPKQVFDSYRIYARADEPLATVGVTAGSATYYTGHPVEAFDSATDGFRWLNASTERRFLAVREKDLAQLNSLYRKRRAVRGGEADASIGAGPGNLPVLDARSSEILLVSNQLRAGEVSHNPFADCVLDVRPQASHPMDSNLGGRLEVLGWEITDPDGRLVDTMSPGGSYVFRIYYEVLRPMSSAWETFIHIDGQHRRFNGDHPTLGGRYPARLWRPGDYIADIHPFRLDPNFTPGTYQVFFGLFLGSRRLEVERGPNDDDRLRAGSIQVQ